MDPLPPEIVVALAAFVFVGFTTQAATGFGGTVISLSLGALVAPIQRLVPLVVAASVVQTTVIFLRNRGDVAWRLLLVTIFPLMGLGAVLGWFLQKRLGGAELEAIYGSFVCCVAIRELWRATRAQPEEEEKEPEQSAPEEAESAPGEAEENAEEEKEGSLLPPWRGFGPPIGTLIAGMIHGIYASGGPLLVWVVQRLGIPKAAFRATLISVWLPINSCLLVSFVMGERITKQDLPAAGSLLIPIALALVVGEWVHRRVDERRFRALASGVLLIAGGALVVSTLRRLVA